jgi:hypothetical protein
MAQASLLQLDSPSILTPLGVMGTVVGQHGPTQPGSAGSDAQASKAEGAPSGAKDAAWGDFAPGPASSAAAAGLAEPGGVADPQQPPTPWDAAADAAGWTPLHALLASPFAWQGAPGPSLLEVVAAAGARTAEEAAAGTQAERAPHGAGRTQTGDDAGHPGPPLPTVAPTHVPTVHSLC